MKVGYQLLKRNGENSKTAKMSISLKRYSTRRQLGPEDTRFYVRIIYFKHTLIYTFGKGFIDAITSLGNLITDLWVKIIVGIQYLIEQKGIV